MCKCPIQRQHRTLKNALYLGGTHRSVQLFQKIYMKVYLSDFLFICLFQCMSEITKVNAKQAKFPHLYLCECFHFLFVLPFLNFFFLFFSFGHFTFQIILLVASVIIFLVWGSSCVFFFFFFRLNRFVGMEFLFFVAYVIKCELYWLW